MVTLMQTASGPTTLHNLGQMLCSIAEGPNLKKRKRKCTLKELKYGGFGTWAFRNIPRS